MTSISMVGSVLSIRAWFRIRCLVRFTGLIWLWVELGYGCDVMVSVSLSRMFRIKWDDTKMKGRIPEYGTVLGLGLCVL